MVRALTEVTAGAVKCWQRRRQCRGLRRAVSMAWIVLYRHHWERWGSFPVTVLFPRAGLRRRRVQVDNVHGPLRPRAAWFLLVCVIVDRGLSLLASAILCGQERLRSKSQVSKVGVRAFESVVTEAVAYGLVHPLH